MTVPAWFHARLTELATSRRLSLSALVLPWIEAGHRAGLVADEPQNGETRQLTVRIPQELYTAIRGERGKLPDLLVPGWIMAGYMNKKEEG